MKKPGRKENHTEQRWQQEHPCRLILTFPKLLFSASTYLDVNVGSHSSSSSYNSENSRIIFGSYLKAWHQHIKEKEAIWNTKIDCTQLMWHKWTWQKGSAHLCERPHFLRTCPNLENELPSDKKTLQYMLPQTARHNSSHLYYWHTVTQCGETGTSHTFTY